MRPHPHPARRRLRAGRATRARADAAAGRSARDDRGRAQGLRAGPEGRAQADRREEIRRGDRRPRQDWPPSGRASRRRDSSRAWRWPSRARRTTPSPCTWRCSPTFPSCPSRTTTSPCCTRRRATTSGARDELDRGAAAAPDYAIAYENLGDVYARLAGVNYEKADRPRPAQQDRAAEVEARARRARHARADCRPPRRARRRDCNRRSATGPPSAAAPAAAAEAPK